MENKYSNLSTRIKAAFVDIVVVIILMYSASMILNLFDSVPNYVRGVIFVILLVLYEPILVSIFGATVGHFFNDIIVKSEKNENKNINFPMALVRYCVKFFLGWISLLTVTGDEKKQAIHDHAAKSIVKSYEKVIK